MSAARRIAHIDDSGARIELAFCLRAAAGGVGLSLALSFFYPAALSREANYEVLYFLAGERILILCPAVRSGDRRYDAVASVGFPACGHVYVGLDIVNNISINRSPYYEIVGSGIAFNCHGRDLAVAAVGVDAPEEYGRGLIA